MPSPESITALNRINIVECNEALVNITKLTDRVRMKEGRLPLLHEGAASRLVKVCEELPEGIIFYVTRCLRTLDEQTIRWQTYRGELENKHPEWPNSVLNRETNKVYAPFNHKTPPPHSTGAAIDLYFMRESDGSLLDIMPPLENWKEGYTASKVVSRELQELRAQLCGMMETQGFSNYPLEYWYYSYGDSAWAARNGLAECMYGAVPSAMIEDR
ncbi:M15 family metallopeptidase [soil metagenome]